jgi:hypothetical protein
MASAKGDLTGFAVDDGNVVVVVVVVVVMVAAGAVGAGAGSGVLQALPPHGSMLLAAEKALVTLDVDVVGAAFCAGCGAGADRLNADDMLG